MIQRPDGAYNRCCAGLGYWWDGSPAARDLVLYTPRKVGRWYIYLSEKWPAGKKATLPKD